MVVGLGSHIPLMGMAMVVKREIPIPHSILPLSDDPITLLNSVFTVAGP
jgi:hypothetical protein